MFEADPPEVVLERPVRADAAQRRLPGVAVGVHEARHHDLSGHVEDLAVARLEVGLDRGDASVLDQHVRALEVAERRVECEDVPVLDQQPVAAHRARLSRQRPAAVNQLIKLRESGLGPVKIERVT